MNGWQVDHIGIFKVLCNLFVLVQSVPSNSSKVWIECWSQILYLGTPKWRSLLSAIGIWPNFTCFSVPWFSSCAAWCEIRKYVKQKIVLFFFCSFVCWCKWLHKTATNWAFGEAPLATRSPWLTAISQQVIYTSLFQTKTSSHEWNTDKSSIQSQVEKGFSLILIPFINRLGREKWL